MISNMLLKHVQSQVHRILIRTSLQQQPQRTRTNVSERIQLYQPGRRGGTRRFRMANGMQLMKENTKTLSRSAYLESGLIFSP